MTERGYCRELRDRLPEVRSELEPRRDEGALGPLLTIGEVGRVLNVSRATVYRLMERGELKPIRILSRTRFDAGEIRIFIERHRTP